MPQLNLFQGDPPVIVRRSPVVGPHHIPFHAHQQPYRSEAIDMSARTGDSQQGGGLSRLVAAGSQLRSCPLRPALLRPAGLLGLHVLDNDSRRRERERLRAVSTRALRGCEGGNVVGGRYADISSRDGLKRRSFGVRHPLTADSKLLHRRLQKLDPRKLSVLKLLAGEQHLIDPVVLGFVVRGEGILVRYGRVFLTLVRLLGLVLNFVEVALRLVVLLPEGDQLAEPGVVDACRAVFIMQLLDRRDRRRE
mmetsp:Transcript_20024/g.51995  ORF Transcript_20024/g.51995 Transcript_20024/m.51995 type:complete len:250 (-) Transcript_20024:672-1421(-)